MDQNKIYFLAVTDDLVLTKLHVLHLLALNFVIISCKNWGNWVVFVHSVSVHPHANKILNLLSRKNKYVWVMWEPSRFRHMNSLPRQKFHRQNCSISRNLT